MISFKKNKIFEGARLRCKEKFDSRYEIGKEYTIDAILFETKDYCDIYINNNWFTLLFNDNEYTKEEKSIFPLANYYFFTDQEERKIKLQIINLQSKIKIQ